MMETPEGKQKVNNERIEKKTKIIYLLLYHKKETTPPPWKIIIKKKTLMEAAAYCNENVTVMLMKADRIETAKKFIIIMEKKKNENITKYSKNKTNLNVIPGGLMPLVCCVYYNTSLPPPHS